MLLGRPLGVMQGRLLPKYKGRYQAHPKGYWKDEFANAAFSRLDLIEFILDFEDARENPLLAPGGLDAIRAASRGSGVGVRTVCADYFMAAPLHAPDPEARAASGCVLADLIRNCAALGVTDIVIPCVDQGSLRVLGGPDNLCAALASALPLAEESGVRLALETDLAPDPFARLLDQIGSPWATVNYDIGNSAALGYDPTEEFAAYGSRITDVHLKDRATGGGPVVLGTGAADFAAVFGELDRVGYRGPLIMQAWRDEEGVAVFARQLAWLQEKLARAKPIRPLVGPRIALHPFAERFITEEYLAWLRDAEVTRFIVKAGLDVTLPDVRAFCHRLIESPDDFFFAIVHDGRHIGNARLGPIDWSTGISGYGILIGDRSFHNRGFGAEVIELVSSFAFNELKLRALRFPVVEEHAAAMRLYRKCGFAEEGPWPEPFVRDGQSLSMTTFTKFSSRAA